MRVRVMSSHRAVEEAIDKSKIKNHTWESTNEIWLWPNDPRFRKERVK